MAEHTGNWYPIGPVKWDAQGNPYRDTSDGLKAYIPPIAAAQERGDPKLLAWAKAHGANVTYGANDANGNPTTSDVRTGAPEGGFSGNYHWNADTGGYEKDNFFDSSLGGLVLGGSAVAAPLALSALGVGAPAAAAPSVAGPMAGAETGIAATTAATAPPASIAATTAGTASGIAPAVRSLISTAAPFAIRAATGGSGSGAGTGVNGLSPEQNDLLTQLIKMSMQRQQESAPIHQAAMALAGNLAPKGSWADSPRFQEAVQQTGGPGPVTPTNPSIAAAYAKLMGPR